MTTVNVEALEANAKQMYSLVAEQPHGIYHFEMGRSLAERLGYDPGSLDRIPVGAVEHSSPHSVRRCSTPPNCGRVGECSTWAAALALRRSKRRNCSHRPAGLSAWITGR